MAAVTPDSPLVKLFEDSPFAQALIRGDGSVVLANAAFARLVGDHQIAGKTLDQVPLARDHPTVLAAIREAASENWPVECRARISSSMELVVWVAPAPVMDRHVHLIARIAET